MTAEEMKRQAFEIAQRWCIGEGVLRCSEDILAALTEHGRREYERGRLLLVEELLQWAIDAHGTDIDGPYPQWLERAEELAVNGDALKAQKSPGMPGDEQNAGIAGEKGGGGE